MDDLTLGGKKKKDDFRMDIEVRSEGVHPFTVL